MLDRERMERVRVLNDKEKETMRLIADGLRDGETAKRLGVARCTIRHRVRLVCEKLGARTRAQAVAMFVLDHGTG